MLAETVTVNNFRFPGICWIHWMFIILLACIIRIYLLLVRIMEVLAILILNVHFWHVSLSITLVEFHFHFFLVLAIILFGRFVHILLGTLWVGRVSIINDLICGRLRHCDALIRIQARPLLGSTCRTILSLQVLQGLFLSSLHKHLEVVWRAAVLIHSSLDLLFPVDSFEQVPFSIY